MWLYVFVVCLTVSVDHLYMRLSSSVCTVLFCCDILYENTHLYASLPLYLSVVVHVCGVFDGVCGSFMYALVV